MSNIERKEERQSSPSFDWMHDPPAETDHNEQVESSRKQGSNAELIAMMIRMKQSMRERDNQMRAQLHLRDEYLDVELRRRDWFLEVTIKQRDLEWKRELKERDAMWREELKERDVAFWVESGKHEYSLCKMLETRDKQMQDSLVSKGQEWLNSLYHLQGEPEVDDS